MLFYAKDVDILHKSFAERDPLSAMETFRPVYLAITLNNGISHTQLIAYLHTCANMYLSAKMNLPADLCHVSISSIIAMRKDKE